MDNAGTLRIPAAEMARISAGGGKVEGGYVSTGDKSLALFRSFGDRDFKQDPRLPIITAVPAVCSVSMGDASHLILGTDGLFDYLDDDRVAAIVTSGADANALVDAAVQNMRAGNGDNCTALVVSLDRVH